MEPARVKPHKPAIFLDDEKQWEFVLPIDDTDFKFPVIRYTKNNSVIYPIIVKSLRSKISQENLAAPVYFEPSRHETDAKGRQLNVEMPEHIASVCESIIREFLRAFNGKRLNIKDDSESIKTVIGNVFK